MGNESSVPSKGQIVVVGSRRVRIKSRLGEGGFAFVYLVTDEATGENLVLKRMSIASDDEDTLAVARHELDVLSKLPVHPNICRLVESAVTAVGGPQSGQKTAANTAKTQINSTKAHNTRRSSITGMLGSKASTPAHLRELDDEDDDDSGAPTDTLGSATVSSASVIIDLLLENCNLGTVLSECDDSYKTGVPVSERTLLLRFRDALAGVAHLHAQSPPILHLDIKPENLLLKGANRDSATAKLCDFGSCREGAIPLDTELNITKAESLVDKCTTLAYRAPEIADVRSANMLMGLNSKQKGGKVEIGPPVDVWALGCLLYRLAFQKTPFEDTHGAVQRMGIMNGKINIPGGRYSDRVAQLIAQCLQVDPLARPTAAALLSTVQAMLEARPVHTTATYATTVPTGRQSFSAPTMSSKTLDDDGMASSIGVMAESISTRWMQLLGSKGSDTDKQRWVIKATSVKPGPPKGKYVRRLVLDAWESHSGGAVTAYLPRRPVTEDVVVALKASALTLKLVQHGPIQAVRAAMSISHLMEAITNAWGPRSHAGNSMESNAAFRHFVARYAEAVASKLHLHELVSSMVGTDLDGTYGMDSVAVAAARAVETNKRTVLSAVTHSLRHLTGTSATTSRDPTMMLALLEKTVEQLQLDADVLREALSVDDLHGVISIKQADSRTIKATHECVVGASPMLLCEAWYCFQASVAIALTLRENAALATNPALQACMSRISTLLPTLRADCNTLLEVYAHPGLARYMDAIPSPPVFPLDNPFSHADTAAKFLAATASPQSTFSPSKSVAPSVLTDDEVCDNPRRTRVDRGDLDPANLVKRIQSVEGNNRCAECGINEATWASINLGITLCLRCSGAHRQLGVHISQVRSLNLDKWKPTWLVSMLCIGNVRSNKFWEYRSERGIIPGRPDAGSDLAHVYAWMKDKYERRVWAAPGTSPEEVLQAKLAASKTSTPTKPVSSSEFEPFVAHQPSAAGGCNTSPSRPAQNITFDDFGETPATTFQQAVSIAPNDFEFPDVSGAAEIADVPDDASDADSLTLEEGDVAARIEVLRRAASIKSPSEGINEFTAVVAEGSDWWQSSFEEKAGLPPATVSGTSGEWWSSVASFEAPTGTHSHSTSAPAVLEVAAGDPLRPPSAGSMGIPPEAQIGFEDIQMGARIGVGGFAVVNKAVYHGQTVAVKQLLRQAADGASPSRNEKLAHEFLAEVRLMLKLRHPNIVTLVGASVDPLALVMEFCARGNLYDVLHNPKIPLDWALKLKIAVGAARGMAYLHSASPPLIHRDLKSQNIFLTEDWTAKIGDFGLSRLKAISSSDLMTAQCGTFHWMAPELITSFRYTEAVDVYSFGINLWEILTRKLPYEGMESMQIGYAVVHSGLRPAIPADTPLPFANLMQRCWHATASERPTFEVIVHELSGMQGLGWK